jgi:nuclear pore complex protein Nup188
MESCSWCNYSPSFLLLCACLQFKSSWKLVSTALSDPKKNSSPNAHPNLEGFLNDPEVLQLLARPYNPYSFNKNQTKTSFETKTAAINVTPTSKGLYDIGEIKEDALWLSKEAQIDEVSALRLVVLEYQGRSSAQLLCDFGEEEAACIQEAAGNGPESLAMVPTAAVSSGNVDKFNSQGSRRIRALRLFLSERRYLLKCAASLLQTGLDQHMDAADGTGQAGNRSRTWVDQMGTKVCESIRESGRSMQEFLMDSIRSLKMSFAGLENGSGWFAQDGGHEVLEIDWLGNKIIEAVHTMEIVFSILDFQRSIPSSDSVLEWFRFVMTFGFFDEFNSVCPLIRKHL